jgi:RNA polymerase sigma-70 factor, ECF subfamily
MSTGREQPGREDRFRATYASAYDDVLPFLERRVHPSHAEELAAEVFLTAWRRFDDLPLHPPAASVAVRRGSRHGAQSQPRDRAPERTWACASRTPPPSRRRPPSGMA